MYTEARLGQLWQVLTPLLNAGVYYLIFGLLLGTNRGVPNYVSFLVTGIFVFNFTQRAFITSSQVIRDTLPLIRALYFPRACLPLGYVLIELQQLILSFAVLFVIVLISGEPITPYWLLIIPALILQTVFNVGCGLFLARWGAGFDDVSQLLPFIVRTWLYVSGVLFSLQALTLTLHGKLSHHHHLAYLLQINPAAVYITLIRNALLRSERDATPGAQPYNCGQMPPLPGLSRPETDLQRVLPSCPARHSRAVAVGRGLGRGGSDHRLPVLLARGGEVRPWLTPWWSWTTCTWCTASTAATRTRARRPARCCG